jgi:hypothetical protein
LIALGLTLTWAQPAIPDTPAGRAFSAWLAAFNSGERSRIDSYYAKYEPDKTADSIMGFRDATGGFDLISIRKTEPLHIEVLVKEKKSELTAIGKLDVKDGEGGTVTAFMLRAIPKGSTIEDFKIDAATRSRVIDGALENLNAYYVFPDVARKMEEAVRLRQKKGEYDSVTDGDSFAHMLTSNLQDVSHDKHLHVNFSPAKLPEGLPGAGQDGAAQYRKQMERMNCGFDKVERLAGNVGYLKFGMFADPEVCGPTAIAAMNFLANVDAIIFDLRENGGGDPKMIALLSTYLFAKQTHLNDLWERKTDTTQQYWTLPYVPGKRLDDKPVFVLTSKRTFSGAEEFSYNLKNLKRATIIGETTGGGAHPVSGHRIDDHFMIGVPFARAINPTSKTNWEGVGVEPDVKVPAADALTEAQKLAAKKPASK